PLAAYALPQPVERAHHLLAFTGVERAEPDLRVEQPLRALHGERQAQLAGDAGAGDGELVRDAVELDVVERAVPVRFHELDRAVQDARMVLEVAADQVVRIA